MGDSHARASYVLLLGLLLGAACQSARQDPVPTPLTTPAEPAEGAGQAEPTKGMGMTAQPAKALPLTADALPFTISLEELSFTDFTKLQSYSAAVSDDNLWVLLGGRTVGLHTFFSPPKNNFPPEALSSIIYVIDPAKRAVIGRFDAKTLPTNLARSLQATNQQSYYDRASKQWYIIGGYGLLPDNKMGTFDTITRVSLPDLIAAILAPGSDSDKAATIAKLFTQARDARFQVTGGALHMLGNTFYLVFGQSFMGMYAPFGGSDFKQTYTEQVRVFTLNKSTLKILSYGALQSSDEDHPFHRRDGNFIVDIDPKTGKERLAAFGGVFPPGIIGAYSEPIYITDNQQVVVDRSVKQLFSAYECPVAVVYDAKGQAVYRTFFGGISHYYYFQTPSQAEVYEQVTKEGRNDGLPFIADISTFVQKADGTYQEWLYPAPMPENSLLGASARLLPNITLLAQGKITEEGIVRLDQFQSGESQVIGYIAGGIQADNPLPIQTSTGTDGTNRIFAVTLTYTPMSAMPAQESAKEAIASPNYQHGR